MRQSVHQKGSIPVPEALTRGFKLNAVTMMVMAVEAMGIKSIIDNLIDAVEDLMDKTGLTSNRKIVEAFFNDDEYLKFAKDVNMADLLNGVDLNALAKADKGYEFW